MIVSIDTAIAEVRIGNRHGEQPARMTHSRRDLNHAQVNVDVLRVTLAVLVPAVTQDGFEQIDDTGVFGPQCDHVHVVLAAVWD